MRLRRSEVADGRGSVALLPAPGGRTGA